MYLGMYFETFGIYATLTQYRCFSRPLKKSAIKVDLLQNQMVMLVGYLAGGDGMVPVEEVP